jgi:hypothetical protein
MHAKVTKPFKGRAAGSQQVRDYKPGDIIEDPRVAAQAVRIGKAEPLRPQSVGKAPPERQASAGPAETKSTAGGGAPAVGDKPEPQPDPPAGRDPRPPAPSPAPLRGERRR